MKKVCIDPGHGGKDPGATGGTEPQIKESRIVFAISCILAQKLINNGYNPYLTRRGVEYIDLNKRAKIANNLNADLFISIHNNAFSSGSPSGIETLFYPGSKNGQLLAEHIQNSFIINLQRDDRGIKPRDNLAVLRETAMPAVLCEIGFITNNTEKKLLQDDNFQLLAAESIFNGIQKYFKE
ncbi:MAG: N-acetylmuramoyl-L-alanine amidase family protein [Bacillota bacterium]